MPFYLSQSVLTKFPELKEHLQNDRCLDIRDSQQARMVARILNTRRDRTSLIPAWKVSAAAQQLSIMMEVLKTIGDPFILLSTIEIQEIKEAIQEEFPAQYIFAISILRENPAVEFLNVLFEGVPEIAISSLSKALQQTTSMDDSSKGIIDELISFADLSQDNLVAQMEHIRNHWSFLSKSQHLDMNKTMKFVYEEIEEEKKKASAPERVLAFEEEQQQNISFEEPDWKRNLVLIAKNANVWLHQLSKQYGRSITHLDQIPEKEISTLAERGVNSLWLIGIWQRSPASKRIKELYGRTDTTASAYSIKEYSIAEDLGGELAVDALVDVCERFGIRLCVDIVPNHTGVDSTWILDHPDWYINVAESPIYGAKFTSEDLSPTSNISIQLEDGYYAMTGASEVFLYQDHQDEKKHYVFHGNDGTSMPWNDTAQLNYLNPEVREHMLQTILRILKKFPLIRFDAAMTLTKKHYQRLWYPLPDTEERCIPYRETNTMTASEFDAQMPNEFWQAVVDRVAQERPDSILMAEAFWLMEGYFINELGMHRVYNSAFMNLLRDEENDNYQQILKNALINNPYILSRFVNFLNNPDERTAADQFGKGEKYFAMCTMLATMPGLPMLGHGQIEGLEERYGMDFLAPKWEEEADEQLIKDHEKWFFPLLHNRTYFSDAASFSLMNCVDNNGKTNPDVFAYFNTNDDKTHLVIVNNSFNTQDITFRESVPMNKVSAMESDPQAYPLTELLPAPSASTNKLTCIEIRTNQEFYFKREDLDQGVGMRFRLSPYQHLVLEIIWKG